MDIQGMFSRDDLEQTLDVFRQLDPPGTPLTTDEVTDKLDYTRDDTTAILRRLVDRGALQTKATGEDTRVWWRPVNQDYQLDSQPEFARAQFQELVQEVTDYAIFVLDADGHIQTWNAGAKHIKGYERDEIIGEHVSTFYTESDREAGRPEQNLRRAVEHGRIEDEGKRVRKDGSTFWANVTITALYDGDELRGYAKVTRDMTERHEYERAIEKERERLEFMNRIIRHNVLNGLNLVGARTEVVQDSLAPDAGAQEHLETVQHRVEDLTSVINTMRKFMDAVVSESGHDTEPVPIYEALERKIELTRDSYPDAVFEAFELPDTSTLVVADDLVGEVFENVLSNAVIHNDKETPHIAVWTSETTCEVAVAADTGEILPAESTEVVTPDVEVHTRPALAVHIADNGPGIADDEKEEILKKGVSGMGTPGSGLGLYLVNEMMDAYGGRVEIREPETTPGSRTESPEDADGVVFDLVFLRAESGGDQS